MHLPLCFGALMLWFVAGTALSATVTETAPAIVDTHAHITYVGPQATDYSAALEAAVRRMDQNAIRSIIVMPPPMTAARGNVYDIEDYAAAVGRHPGRVLAAGGGGTLNPMLHSAPAEAVTAEVSNRFRARAEAIAAAGAVAYGEIALHHLALAPMGPQHPYEAVAPDHPLLLMLADIAAEKDIPIDVHLDLVPDDMDLPARPAFGAANPPVLRANLAAFERLLAHNRRARIVWAHSGSDPLGTRTPAVQRELLSRHPNLYMSLRLPRGAPAPAFALTLQGRMKPEWAALIRDFSDRFVIGTDYFHAAEGTAGRGPDEQSLANYSDALSTLPAATAAALAHGNAEKLYRLRR